MIQKIKKAAQKTVEFFKEYYALLLIVAALGLSGYNTYLIKRLITFDVTVDTASADIQEVITNSVTVNYTDSSTKNWSRSGPNVIVNSAKGRDPEFIEVAP